VAFASSLDQIGPMARSAADCALVLEAIAGHDPGDSTSLAAEVPHYGDLLEQPLTGLRIGRVAEHYAEGLDPEVRKGVDEAFAVFEAAGATIHDVELPHAKYGVPTYYLIAPCEASSNLARYDGAHYGHRCDKLRGGFDSPLVEMYCRSRGEGFGPEVKRRIMLGTYALSSGYYDAYYGQAQKVRTLIARDFANAFAKVDVLVSPTAPTTAFRIGEKVDDPIAMYLNDIATIPVNLAGNCAMSLPIGLAPEDGLPVGLQIMAPALADDRLYRVGSALEQALVDSWGHLLIEEVPDL